MLTNRGECLYLCHYKRLLGFVGWFVVMSMGNQETKEPDTGEVVVTIPSSSTRLQKFLKVKNWVSGNFLIESQILEKTRYKPCMLGEHS